MSDVEIVNLGASSLDPETGAERWQSTVPITDSAGDVEHFGEIEVFQSLGLTSLPAPANENGHAEGLIHRGVPGRSAIGCGGRDTRSKIAAGLKPGDTCLHATTEDESAQVRCLGTKRTVVNITKDSDGESMALILDGKNDKAQLVARGTIFQIEKNGDSLWSNGQASIVMQGGHLYFMGMCHFDGIPPGLSLMAGPPTGQTGPVGVTLVAVLGVGK